MSTHLPSVGSCSCLSKYDIKRIDIKAKKKTCTTRVSLPSSPCSNCRVELLDSPQACSFALPFGPCLRNLQFEISKQAGLWRHRSSKESLQQIMGHHQDLKQNIDNDSNVTFLTTSSTRFPLQIQIQVIQRVKWKH